MKENLVYIQRNKGLKTNPKLDCTEEKYKSCHQGLAVRQQISKEQKTFYIPRRAEKNAEDDILMT